MAVRFDAAESYVSTLTLGSQANFTFSCWAKINTDRNTFTTVWSFDQGMDGSMFGLQTDTDGTTMKVFDDAVSSFVVTGPNMTVGVWYYFAVVVAGTSGTLYYRAATTQVMSSATWTSGARTITRVLVGDDRYTEWLNGCVAGFSFWTAGLTAAEVANESQRYMPYRLANLQMFCPFIKAETADYSGLAHTLTGGATTATEDGPPIPWKPAAPRIVLPPPAAGGTTFPVSVAGAVTPAAALVRSPQKLTAGAVTPQGALAKQTQRRLTGTTTPAGVALKLLARALAGSATPTGAVTSIRSRLLSLTGAITPSSGLVRQPGKKIAGASTPAGALTKQAGTHPAGSVTPTGALATIRTRLLALVGAIAPTGQVTRQPGKAVAGSAAPAGSVVRSVARRLLGAVTPAGAVSATRTRLLAVAGAVTPAGVLARRAGKSLAGSLSPVGAVVKRASRTITGQVSPSGLVLKLVGRALGGSTAPSGAVGTLLGSAPEDAGTFESGNQVRRVWDTPAGPVVVWSSRREVRTMWEVDQ